MRRQDSVKIYIKVGNGQGGKKKRESGSAVKRKERWRRRATENYLKETVQTPKISRIKKLSPIGYTYVCI